MKKIIGILLLSFFLVSDAHAMKQLLIGGAGSSAPSSAGVTYMIPMTFDRPSNATETSGQSIVAYAGTISGFNVRNGTTAPGAAKTLAYAVRKNGVDTGMGCSFTGTTDFSCTDNVNTFTVLPGDLISISITPTGTPSTSSLTRSFLTFDSVSSHSKSIYSFSANGVSLSNSATRYLPMTGANSGVTATELNTFMVVPTAGYIENMVASLVSAPGSGKSYTITLRKNSADTGMVFAISGTATSGESLPNRIAVSAGDIIDVSVVPAGTPTATPINMGWTFKSDTERKFLFMSNSFSTSSSASANNYNGFGGTALVFSATNTANVSYFFNQTITISDMSVYLQTAPNNGAGTQSYTISLFDATTTTATVVTCPVSEAATTCTFSGGSFVPGTSTDRYNIEVIPSGTPAVSKMSFSLVANYPIVTQNTTIKQATLKQATIKGY